MKCKPVPCPACGGPLSTPSMMSGCMTCQDCEHPWDQEWLCRFTAALAACRRALTVAEKAIPFLRPATIGKRSILPGELRAQIKAARTAMDNAQGRSK